MTAGLAAQVRPASRKSTDQSTVWKRRLWRAAGGTHIARAQENHKSINHFKGRRKKPHLPERHLVPFSGTENNVQTTH
jgi:hypothetical protein